MTNPKLPVCYQGRQRQAVLSVPVDAVAWEEALARLLRWAAARESRYVCLCNVHSVVTATRDARFRQIIEQADLAAPDGMPVAWTLRWQGSAGQQRINGPDLMWRYLAEAERLQQRVFFYGATEPTLYHLQQQLRRHFPALKIAGMYAPPFRRLSEEEEAADAAMINAAGTQVVMVGLGCPKQEIWMARQRGHVQAVMLGVGAAFDYHAGVLRRAPLWMQRAGLEWLHRLALEPRRLAKRYLLTNTLFILGLLRQTIRGGRL